MTCTGEDDEGEVDAGAGARAAGAASFKKSKKDKQALEDAEDGQVGLIISLPSVHTRSHSLGAKCAYFSPLVSLTAPPPHLLSLQPQLIELKS